jgi:hypothetical protein
VPAGRARPSWRQHPGGRQEHRGERAGPEPVGRTAQRRAHGADQRDHQERGRHQDRRHPEIPGDQREVLLEGVEAVEQPERDDRAAHRRPPGGLRDPDPQGCQVRRRLLRVRRVGVGGGASGSRRASSAVATHAATLTQPTSTNPPTAISAVAATAAGTCATSPAAPTHPWTRA